MEKKLLELAVEIVQAQASTSKMTGDEIELSLVRVYNALHKMRLAEDEGRSILCEDAEPPVSRQAVAIDPDPFLHSGRQGHLHGVRGGIPPIDGQPSSLASTDTPRIQAKMGFPAQAAPGGKGPHEIEE